MHCEVFEGPAICHVRSKRSGQTVGISEVNLGRFLTESWLDVEKPSWRLSQSAKKPSDHRWDQTLSPCATTALTSRVISRCAAHSFAPTPPDSPPPSRKSVAALSPRSPALRKSTAASRFRARALQSPALIADDPLVFHLGDPLTGVAATRMTASARFGAAAQTSPHESTHIRACGSPQSPNSAGKIEQLLAILSPPRRVAAARAVVMPPEFPFCP